MLQFLSNVTGGLGAALKWAAYQNPMLLNAGRSVRSFFRKQLKPRKLLPGYSPLCIDEKELEDFGQISHTARDLILAEFAEISRFLEGVDTGLGDSARAVLQNPFDGLLLSAANLNFVYTPGKVGSSTVAATLEGHPAIRSPIPVAHFLSTKGLAYVQRVGEQTLHWPQELGTLRESVFWSRMMRLRVMLSLSLPAKKGLLGTAIRKPIVITGVREPVAGHLSWCFYGWWQHADKPAGVTLKVVHDLLTGDPWHRRCNDWFNDELKEMLGVDVYARPFPIERGWDIYENDAVRVLLVRQESFDSLSVALGELYGINPTSFNIVSTNKAESTSYAAYFDNVKKNLRLSKQELEEIYGTPYVRHFYSPNEIAAFKKRWQTDEMTRKAA